MALREITPELRSFLEGMKVPCVLSTLRADGAPITSATWFGFWDEFVIVSTPIARTKARNVRRDPRVSFLVDSREMPYCGVAIEGTGELVEDADGALLRLIVERYLGPQPPEEFERRLASRGERVIVKIVPERVRPWGFALTPNPSPARAGEGSSWRKS
jgi:PPOX class probable F420-dependent enzyme